MKLGLLVISLFLLQEAANASELSQFEQDASLVAAATEPAYCDLAKLKTFEIKNVTAKVKNLHAYKLGQVVLAGLAVGQSKVAETVKMATGMSNTNSQDGYCTWYFNDGNSEAEKTFNWHYLDRPDTSTKSVNQYMALAPEFDSAKVNMLQCAAEHGYLAMGCDGMKHRGPTVFGMVLAYSGCTAAHANNIVNTVWGTNGIDPKAREAIMQKAYEYGKAHPDQSSMFQQLLTTN